MNIDEAVKMEEERLDKLCQEGKISQEQLRDELDYVHRDARAALQEEAQRAYDEVMKGSGL